MDLSGILPTLITSVTAENHRLLGGGGSLPPGRLTPPSSSAGCVAVAGRVPISSPIFDSPSAKVLPSTSPPSSAVLTSL